MNEEERSNLYIYTYSDLDDDFIFAETIYTLGDLHRLQQELQKYKSLYENEKDKNDTLIRIIKKIEEILQNEYKENIFGHYEYDLATAKNTIKKILDLLKEIK